MFAVRLPVGLLVSSVLLGMLAGCGGGGGGDGTAVSANPNCEPCVISGFTGDLDWELYQTASHSGDGTGGIGGEGIGGGSDGAGGVGAGGSLGQFRRALVVARFADGSEIGRALTDDVAGMVTIRPGRTYTGPVLVEIHGQDGATYFEEGKNVPVPFGPGRVLRAVVPSVTRNIGITPFSEAGYQLAMLCQSGAGPAAVCATAPGGGNATVPGSDAITAGNGHVTTTLNQQMPNALAVDDVTRLPHIVGTDTPADAIDNTPRGRYGLANIAFSKQAAMFNTAEPAPTLLATEQLALDLQDGRLDGVVAGAPIATAARRTYDPHSLTSELSAALAQQTVRYGDAVTRGLLPVITAFGNTRYDSYYFDATLEPSGSTQTIAVATESESTRRAPGQRTVYAGPGQQDARGFMLYGNMGSGALFIKTDSTDSTSAILAVGDNRNGELGNGTRTATGSSTGPARITLPAVLTHAAGGIAHTVARLADGSVWAWGDNSLGQLGQGQPAGALPRSATPLRVPLPAGATAVAASNQASFALLEDGSVWSWGGGWGFGTLGDGTADGVRTAPAPVQSTSGPLAGVVQISARDNDVIALRADSAVLTWGSFSATGTGTDLTGITPGNRVATPIPGLPATRGGVRKVLTEQGLFAVLLAGPGTDGQDLDGAVYAWGVHFDITANAVLPDRVPQRVLNLPPVRDLMPGGFLGYGQRPSDRLTGMAIDYDGRLWKTRGRVAEQYDPANPTAQRRPQGQAPRPDCASCHVVPPRSLPPVPTSGPTCVVPPTILSLLTTASRCENCHNNAPLAGGRVLGALACVPPPDLPPPPPITVTPPRTERCALPVAHPVVQTSAACSSCHNSVVTPPLSCSPDLTPLAPPSTTTVLIDRVLDDAGVAGTIANGGVTDDTTPTLEGRLSAPLAAEEYVTILRGGQPVGQAAAAAGATTWSFTSPAIPVGTTASFTGRIDRNGASSGAVGAAYVVQIANQGPARFPRIDAITDDVEPDTGNVAGRASNDPSPVIVAVVDGGLASGESVRFERVRDNGAAEIVDGTAENGNPARWILAENGLVDGSYRYRAQAVGPSGAGAFSAEVTVRIDTEPPRVQPTLRVQTDAPDAAAAQVRSAATGTRASGLGLSDASPTLVATVSGTAAGDRVEFQMGGATGSAFTALPGTSIVEIGGGSASVTPTIAGAAAALGNASVPPDGSRLSLRFRARVVDAAGNAGPWSTESSHLLGLFNCLDLKQRYPTHNPGIDANAPGSCAGSSCHGQSGPLGAAATFQRMPGGTTATRYWCTFSAGAAVPLSSLRQMMVSTVPPVGTGSSANPSSDDRLNLSTGTRD